MELLIRELNSPQNQGAPERIDAIQKQIQSLQREPSAWQMGLDLLRHDESVMRFYGALTLTIKVNADWDHDKIGENRILTNQLIENLVTEYVRLSSNSEAPFVLLKLASAISAVFQKTDSAWAFPLRQVVASTLAGRYVAQDEAPDMTDLLTAGTTVSAIQLNAALALVLTISEDVSNSSNSITTQDVRTRLSNAAGDVWQMILVCTQSFAKESGKANIGTDPARLRIVGDQTRWFDLMKTTTQIMPLWIGYARAKSANVDSATSSSAASAFQQSARIILDLMDSSAFAGTVLPLFTSLEQSSHGVLAKLVPGYCHRIVTSNRVHELTVMLREGNFDAEAVAYVDFLDAVMSQIDTTSSAYLQEESNVIVLRQAQDLLQCDGVAVIEDVVCQIVLEMLSNVLEGFNDWPQPEDSTDVDPTDQPSRQFIVELVRNVCEKCLAKIRPPVEELSSTTQEWDTDERARFNDFRYDVQDFLQSAFTILGSDLIEALISSIARQGSGVEWDLFEAAVFALIALSDAMVSEPEKYDMYLDMLMRSSLWQAVVHQNSAPDRVRQTVIRFLGESTSFLQRHPENLVPTLNYLFSSLHQQQSAGAASRAISVLCDSQRTILTEALPQFVHTLTTLEDLAGTERLRIFSAVSCLVQALPSEAAKIEPLRRILEIIETETSSLTGRQLEPSELLAGSTAVIQTLAAVGKGLRSPNDVPVQVEPSVDDNADHSQFWITGEGASIQHLTLRTCSSAIALRQGQQDAELVEAVCEFIRSGFPENHPSPFKFSSPIVVETLQQFMQLNNPNPDQTMSTASSYLASTHPGDPSTGFAHLVSSVVQACREGIEQYQQQHEPSYLDLPTSALDFFSRLLPKWGRTWFSLSSSHNNGDKSNEDGVGASTVLSLAVLLLENNDTLPRRTAASFVSSFVEASGTILAHPRNTDTGTDTDPDTDTDTDTVAASTVNHLLDAFSPLILHLLIYLIAGECARSELESLTDPLRRFIVRQGMRTKHILKNALACSADQSHRHRRHPVDRTSDAGEGGFNTGHAIDDANDNANDNDNTDDADDTITTGSALSRQAMSATRPEQRARFLAQIEALRGSRKTNEVVREFWIACRGSGFGYVV